MFFDIWVPATILIIVVIGSPLLLMFHRISLVLEKEKSREAEELEEVKRKERYEDWLRKY